MITRLFTCFALCLSSVVAYGQEVSAESSPVSQQSSTTLPALSINQSEPEKESVRSLFLISAATTGIWLGGVFATIPFANKADASFDESDPSGPIDTRALATGFALLTTSELALNGTLLSISLAQYKHSQKARPLYVMAGVGLLNASARYAALTLFTAEGALFGTNTPSDEGIYGPAYTVGIVSALALTTYATVKAVKHTKAKRASSTVASK